MDAPVGVRVGSTVPAAAKAEAAQQDAAKRAARGAEGAAKRRGAPRGVPARKEAAAAQVDLGWQRRHMLSFYSGLRSAVGPCGQTAYRRFTYAGSIAAIRGLAARVCPAGWRQNPPRLHP